MPPPGARRSFNNPSRDLCDPHCTGTGCVLLFAGAARQLSIPGARMSDLTREALNIEDLRRMARRRLTKALFEFCDRGSEDEIAMRDNRAALDRIKLLPRVLKDVSGRDPGITLFGKKHALPLLIGPTGIAGWVWYRAEIELARAAAHAGIPFTLASTSSTAMEKVLAEGGGTQWYQLYIWRDVEAALVTVARARDAGFEALVLTVDFADL